MNTATRTNLGALASAIGPRFFESLVETLASLTGADYVMVARHTLETPARVQSLAHFALGALAPNLSYELAGTPCADVYRGAPCALASGVQQAYPQDHELVRLGIEAYAGVPLFDSTDAVLGHLAVLHCTPRRDIQDVVAVLQSFSARAASELERTLGEEALRRREERLTLQNAMLVDLARSPAVERGDRAAFLREVSEGIARTLELERSVVCLFDGDLERLVVVDQYESSSAQHSAGVTLSLVDCPRYLEALETRSATEAAKSTSSVRQLRRALTDSQQITPISRPWMRIGASSVERMPLGRE